MENNSANGKYVQRHLPLETLQQRFTCSNACTTSLSIQQRLSCCMLYAGHQHATLPETGDWLRICE